MCSSGNSTMRFSNDRQCPLFTYKTRRHGTSRLIIVPTCSKSSSMIASLGRLHMSALDQSAYYCFLRWCVIYTHAFFFPLDFCRSLIRKNNFGRHLEIVNFYSQEWESGWNTGRDVPWLTQRRLLQVTLEAPRHRQMTH